MTAGTVCISLDRLRELEEIETKSLLPRAKTVVISNGFIDTIKIDTDDEVIDFISEKLIESYEKMAGIRSVLVSAKTELERANLEIEKLKNQDVLKNKKRWFIF